MGEWLTRRILRGLVESGESPDRESWPQAASGNRRAAWEDKSTSTARDAQDMFARISRSESESSNATRKIEEQLRCLGRRLEAAERNHSENSRAVSKAATEINIATREQAQAFDQLGAHVAGLGDRLARVERGTGNDGAKEAVKGLHAGLSRLADQIAETASQTAGQMAALAGNIESVAGKLNEARGESKLATQALATRLSAFDGRVKAVEGVARTNAEKIEHAVAGIKVAQSARQSEEAENQHQALAQLTDTLGKLAARLTTDEAQTAGAMARLEDQIAKVELRQGDPAFDRRLQGIEHVLSDIVGRLENTERNAAGPSRTVEESLRDLSARIDASDKRHRDAIAELRSVLTAAPTHSEPAPAVQPAAVPQAPGANFDLPPFPDMAAQPPTYQQPAPDFAAAAELPPFAAPHPDFAGDHIFAADSFANPAVQPNAGAADSFIAAARRSARAAAETEAQQGGFTWGAGTPKQSEALQPKSGSTRFVLVAGIVLIAIAAVVAGILLSRGLVGSGFQGMQSAVLQHHALSAPATPAPVAAVPSNSEHPAASAAPVVATAPGSPVVSPRPPSPASPVEIKPAPPVQTPTNSAPQPATPVKAQPVSTLDRLTALASAGSAKAELLMGLKYLDGDGVAVNEAEAAKWLERAANQGEAIAAYRLGTLFERGHGVPADTVKAVQWYAVAAKLGNRKAMHNLAVAYAEGSGTPKDMTQAAQWFSKAASLGLANSEFNLAVLYERGMGVQQSLIDAYKWYAIAAAQGDSESKARLEVISTQLSTDERAAAQRAAADFHPAPMDRNANIPPDASTLN